MGENYQKIMEQQLKKIPKGERLLLHSCCAPCSTAVLEQLAQHFAVTLYFYNPNIWPSEEYERRKAEQQQLLPQIETKYPVVFLEASYHPEDFYKVAAPFAQEAEGGKRCVACFSLRLQQAAKTAANLGFGWFTTTLTISPHKNAALLNQIGSIAGEMHGVQFLHADFKKKEGFKRSLQLSDEFGLYRQDYCGCEYSYQARHQSVEQEQL